MPNNQQPTTRLPEAPAFEGRLVPREAREGESQVVHLTDPDRMRESQASIASPLGVDVAGGIMLSVDPVMDVTIAKLRAVITRSQNLIELLTERRHALEADLEARDKYVRGVIKDFAGFATQVEDEYKRIDHALDAIAENHVLKS